MFSADEAISLLIDVATLRCDHYTTIVAAKWKTKCYTALVAELFRRSNYCVRLWPRIAFVGVLRLRLAKDKNNYSRQYTLN